MLCNRFGLFLTPPWPQEFLLREFKGVGWEKFFTNFYEQTKIAELKKHGGGMRKKWRNPIIFVFERIISAITWTARIDPNYSQIPYLSSRLLFPRSIVFHISYKFRLFRATIPNSSLFHDEIFTIIFQDSRLNFGYVL